MSQEVGLGAVGDSPGEEERQVVTKKVAVLGHLFVRDLPLAAYWFSEFLSEKGFRSCSCNI